MAKEMELKSNEIKKRNKLKKEKPHVYEKVLKYNEKFERGESIATIQLQYDYACNFNCQHCLVKGLRQKKGGRVFTIDDVKELSRQADEMGLAHMHISGGEPLIFHELDEIIKALQPEKFYLQCDTNGWLVTDELAKHMKSLGVDRMHVSIDSLDPKEHDEFRCQPGAHERAMRAIDSYRKAGLDMQIATLVTKQRLRSGEFVAFLEFAKEKEAPVCVQWPKPLGAWEGHFEGLIDKEDLEYLRKLRQKYNVYDHLTPGFGIDCGCPAVKRLINITKWGDVLPCPAMYFSLGNFFKEPLRDIISRGMDMECFRKYKDICRTSADRDFIDRYIVKTYGRDIPVPISEIMPGEQAGKK